MNVNTFLVYVFLLTLWGQVSCVCPNGWMRNSNSCYLFEDLKPLSWHDALEICITYEGSLVRIDSQAENDFIKAELKKLQPGPEDQFWTAGNDIAVENEWMWAHSRDKVQLSFWHPGEPNQSGNEDCLSFYTRYQFDWNDEHCDRPMAYICELSDLVPAVSIIG